MPDRTDDILDILTGIETAVRGGLQAIDDPSERDAINLTLPLLTANGGFFWRQNTGVAVSHEKGGFQGKSRAVRFGGFPGAPDIMGTLYGRFVGIEVKMGGTKTSYHQRKWEQACLRAGGIYRVMKF